MTSTSESLRCSGRGPLLKTLLTTLLALGMWGCATPVGAGKVFRGPNGEEVTVLSLLPEKENRSIVYLQGTGTALDGKALPAHLNTTFDRWPILITKLQGHDYRILRLREAKNYELSLPERDTTDYVSYDDSRTQAVKSRDIYALYKKQTKDGTLSKLATFDRAIAEAQHEKRLATYLDSMNKTCGGSATQTVLWKSLADEQLQSLDITSYCSAPLTALEKLCDTNVSRQIIREKARKVVCQWGTTQGLTADAGTVTWTISPDSSNVEEFAIAFFEKNF